MNKKKIVLIICVIVIGLAAAGGAVGLHIINKNNEEWQARIKQDQGSFYQALLQTSKETVDEMNVDTVYPGVYFMSADLGGLTREAALQKINEEVENQILSQEMELIFGDETWTFTHGELGITVDTQVLVEKALKAGRSGNLRQRRQILMALEKDTIVLEAETELRESTLQTVLEQLEVEIWRDPENATISLNGSTFTVTGGKNGVALNVKETKQKIAEGLKSDNPPKSMELEVRDVEPERTAEALSTIHDLIGRYTTSYSTSNAGREQNLRVGASKVNGTVLMPGETFYFNPTVAPVTAEAGYHEANVIVDGEYESDLGGGLCQVSSTLYNAVILAELGIDFRDCHAFPSDYVPMGLDATVAQGYIDFIFTNDTGYPVYLAMWCSGGEIGAAVYGTETHDPSRKISFNYVVTKTIPKPETETVVDEKLAPGARVFSEGHTGYEVDVYKTVTENGVSYTEWFSSSEYMATPDKIKVGPDKK